MPIQLNQSVMLPTYAPYPRYGCVAQIGESGDVLIANVQCGDPRCAAEHHHGNETWRASDLEAAAAYQPRAPWEHGRKSSPNATIE